MKLPLSIEPRMSAEPRILYTVESGDDLVRPDLDDEEPVELPSLGCRCPTASSIYFTPPGAPSA